MIKTTRMLYNELAGYKNPADKIRRLVRDSLLFPVVNGLYETDRETPGKYLAGVIYGPSYVSFDFALALHGLVPEGNGAITSATTGKHKKKEYVTAFGTFLYRDVPGDVFGLEVETVNENGYAFMLATPEKALCDKLYSLPPIKNRANLKKVLFEDLRTDEASLAALDREKILFLSGKYGCTNVRLLEKFLRRLK